MSIGSKIRDLCKENGMSQAALARAVYISKDAMYGYTNERCYPNAEVLHSIAQLFGVPMEYFWEEEEGEQ